MPQLDLVSSHMFWKDYVDPSVYKVIAFMETVEDWTLDGDPHLEHLLEQFSQNLDELSKFELGKEDQFIRLLTHLKTSRILRVLQSIDTIEPGSASRVLMYAEEHNTPDNILVGLFLRRNIAFERLRLLTRVFSAERFQIILKALEQDND